MGIYDEPVVVPENILKRITASLGNPILDLAEDLLITDDTIQELFIRPAMQLYFTYWPKILKKEYPIEQYVNIPFPNDHVYGIAQARVALSQNTYSKSKNPFLNERSGVRVSSSYGITPYGRDPYISHQILIKEQTEKTSYITLHKAGTFSIDEEERCLKGYSNVTGMLIISWAQFFWDWNKVKFEHTEDLIKLCKVYALRFVGGIRAQSDPNTGVSMDGSSFKEEADRLENEVLIDNWKNRIPIVVLH